MDETREMTEREMAASTVRMIEDWRNKRARVSKRRAKWQFWKVVI